MNFTEPIPWIDQDWFAIDDRHQIAHFASGGGCLPSHLSEADFEEIADYFTELPEIPGNVVYVNPGLEWIHHFKSKQAKESYLSNFIFFAKKGLYSFDKMVVDKPVDTRYHLVTWPGKILRPEIIPMHILEKVTKSNDKKSFNRLTEIDISIAF